MPSLRVLDLTDEKGFLCGKILGDLGADVIKIEPPDGDSGRRIGPFYHDIPDLQKSLFWFAYNSNKRGITLSIETADGQEILRKLIKHADILIESFDPGYLDSLGLGYSVLSQINPQLIMVSITAFGQSGPYRDYNSSDIISMAMGGFMYMCGDTDRPPVRPVAPQAYLNAGADAAAGAMIAYYHRERTGEGQQVDISMQQSVSLAMYLAIPYWEVNHFRLRRYGSSRLLGSGVLSRMVWPCKDGYVNFVIHGGATGSRTNRALAKWMDEEEMLPEFMKKIDWDKFDLATVTEDLMNLLNESVEKFFLNHTKAELYEWAMRTQAMLYPVSNCEDLLANTQLNERNFWVKLEHPELGEVITYPGAWAISSEANLNIGYRAPLIGEHNQEIYEAELGMTNEELVMLKQSGVI